MAEDVKSNPETEKSVKKKNRLLDIVAGIFLLAGVIWIASLFFNFSGSVKTNNAQVAANMASINSHITGNILEIRFESYSNVKAGDTLIVIDDAEFRIKVAQADADVAVAKANLLSIEQGVITSVSTQEATEAKLKGNIASLEKSEKNYERFQNMFADSAVTRNQFDQVVSQLKSDQAFVEAAKKEALANKSVTVQNEMNIGSARATLT